jgi:alkyl hydroperoxide reductase subunit AhpC
MRVLNQAARRLGGAARLAIVCHGPPHVVGRWARATQARHEPLALTVILDPEDRLAALYDLVSADGTARWGQFLLDGAAVVRQAQVCRCHVPPDADELVRYAMAIPASPAFDGVEDPCHFRQGQ